MQDPLGPGAPDPGTAARYYQRACDGRNGLACAALAGLYAYGEGVDQDLQRARALFERVVDDGQTCRVTTACLVYAQMLSEGEGARRDIPRAIRIVEEGCTHLDGYDKQEACDVLAKFLFHGAHGFSFDHARALAIAEPNCSFAAMSSCEIAAAVYFNGADGVTQNVPRGVEILTSACESWSRRGHTASCVGAAIRLLVGEGVNQDVSRAVSLLSRACWHGDSNACWIYGQVVLSDESAYTAAEVRSALDRLKKLCGEGAQAACGLVTERARRICETGDEHACATPE